MKGIRSFLIGLAITLFLVGQVGAVSITDLDLTDLNIITSSHEDDALNELLVFEDYNEKHLIPYPSHDGYGIVNNAGGFFDKRIDFTLDDLDGPWMFDFRVHNTTPWEWSDYHFEFWNEDFTSQYQNFPLLSWDNDIFQNDSFDGSIVQFWAPDWQAVCETSQSLLLIDLSLVNAGQAGSFGIRQVATTVPEPCTLLLLGTGLAGIVRYRKKFGKN